MQDAILTPEVQAYIDAHISTQVSALALQGSPFKTVTTAALIEQVEAKQRCQKKLPTWFNTEGIYYPNKLNIEQTSSEQTAQYKAALVSGQHVIDLTGGFGVDDYYFSKSFDHVIHCEINNELSTIVTHNYTVLGVDNIKTIADDGLNYLQNSDTNFDVIYIDPSRRHDTKGKVFFLKDCLPNVPEAMDLLLRKAKTIMIKTSPLLDISVGLSELEHVQHIHVVAVNNEVKELLWILQAETTATLSITTVNIKTTGNDVFTFQLNNEALAHVNYSLPLTYLYEPNAAILKAGAFNSVAETFTIFKLHQHSHLYTSDTIIDFPGRRFKIEHLLPYNKKQFLKLGITKANVTTRNFPESVAQIRKKLKLKDGGDYYIFFTTTMNNDRIICVTRKV